MRTVKEILDKHSKHWILRPEEVEEAMKVYGEELATAFADWINEQGEEADIVDRWLNHKEETATLFKEFIKTL